MGNPLKKTMVFLGLAEEDLDEQGAVKSEPAVQQEAPSSSAAPHRVPAQRAPVTPLRKVTPTRAPASQAMNEILTVHPTEYRDAAPIAESFREGVPVILNLSRMTEPEAKRLIDFASGLSMGLNGGIERVTSKVFLLSPADVNVTAEDKERIAGGFFNQS